MTENRSAFVDQLVENSSVERLYDRDSLPPISKGDGTMEAGGEKDPMEIVTVKDFLTSSRPPISQSEANVRESVEKREGSNSEGGGKRRVVSKITGMVKKGSVHLGLKSTVSTGE